MFDGKYLEWNQKRIKAIIDFYGHKFMYGKKILDLGCGYGDISGVLHRLGADITALDARQEHLKIASKKWPGIKVVKADLDRPWPFIGKHFDLILDLDLINHLSDYESHLKAVCASCTHLILELSVSDASDPLYKICGREDKNIYDLSVNGVTSYPSAAAIERIITESGMNFKRMDQAKLNSGSYKYDWQDSFNGSHDVNKRRMWFAVKNNSSLQFVGNNKTQQIVPIQLPGTVGHFAVNNQVSVPVFTRSEPQNMYVAPNNHAIDQLPLKVAVCISGHLRTFEKNFPSVQKYLLSKFDCDVFIHTWDTLGLSYRHSDSHIHSIETSSVFDKIQQLYKPKKLVIESQKSRVFFETKLMKSRAIDHRDIPGILSMYYKIQECNNLKMEYEKENNFKYDFAIRFRGDLSLEENMPIIMDTDKNYLFFPTYGHYGGFNDQFAFGGSNVMDVYSSLYSKVEKHLLAGAVMHPERLLKYHIDVSKLKVTKINVRYLIKRSNGLIQDNMLLERALGFIK